MHLEEGISVHLQTLALSHNVLVLDAYLLHALISNLDQMSLCL